MKELDPNRMGAVANSAGVPPAVAGTSRPRFGDVTIRDRGRLPHWEKDGAIYFITFRLADSLPTAVLERIASECLVADEVVENPEKAHLDRWKWVWMCGRDARTTAAGDGRATLSHL